MSEGSLSALVDHPSYPLAEDDHGNTLLHYAGTSHHIYSPSPPPTLLALSHSLTPTSRHDVSIDELPDAGEEAVEVGG